MARPARPERSRSALPLRQLSRFCYLINSDIVFGTHNAEITVSLLPVMAARWLVPRLSRFTARFPHINLHIKTGQSLANFKSDGVDIAIRFGMGDWKGLRAIKLLDEEFFPVCSPGLKGGRLPKDPVSMLSEPVLID